MNRRKTWERSTPRLERQSRRSHNNGKCGCAGQTRKCEKEC